MPVVDLARRLEDVGVAAITVHCRTAQMGHEGKADWRWAARAQSAVSIPVIVNGDVTSAGLARKALTETGCAGVMIGRRAIEHPWIFRETRSLIEQGASVRAPSVTERFTACREHVNRAIAHYGERVGLRRARRFFRGYLRGLPGGLGSWQSEVGGLETASTRTAIDEAIDAFEALATRPREAPSSAPAEW
jgi:tRNA-dihydrouridine synthase